MRYSPLAPAPRGPARPAPLSSRPGVGGGAVVDAGCGVAGMGVVVEASGGAGVVEDELHLFVLGRLLL